MLKLLELIFVTKIMASTICLGKDCYTTITKRMFARIF